MGPWPWPLNQTPGGPWRYPSPAPATDYQVSLVVNKENPKFSGAGNAIADYDKPGVTFAVMSGWPG